MRILELDPPTSSSDKQQEDQSKPHTDGSTQAAEFACSSVPLNKQSMPDSTETQQSKRGLAVL